MNDSARPEYRPGTDLWLWLDPSQSCNIACALCYTRESHARRFLNEDTLHRLIANLRAVSGLRFHEITFNWRGEPLMNKRFPELLKIVCDGFPGTRVQFHTNAMLITRDVANRLMDVAREYFVYLSIDGGHRRAHESNRGSGTFMTAIRGGHRLLDARNARATLHGTTGECTALPHITLYQLDLGEDEADYDQSFLALAARADQWQRVGPIVRNGEDAATVRHRDTPPSDWWHGESPRSTPAGPCFWAGYSLSVAPDGDTSVCILNQRARHDGVLGNLLREDAATVLSRAAAFREALARDGREQMTHCRQCRKIEGRPRPPRAVDDLKRKIDIHVEN